MPFLHIHYYIEYRGKKKGKTQVMAGDQGHEGKAIEKQRCKARTQEKFQRRKINEDEQVINIVRSKRLWDSKNAD